MWPEGGQGTSDCSRCPSKYWLFWCHPMFMGEEIPTVRFEAAQCSAADRHGEGAPTYMSKVMQIKLKSNTSGTSPCVQTGRFLAHSHPPCQVSEPLNPWIPLHMIPKHPVRGAASESFSNHRLTLAMNLSMQRRPFKAFSKEADIFVCFPPPFSQLSNVSQWSFNNSPNFGHPVELLTYPVLYSSLLSLSFFSIRWNWSTWDAQKKSY